MIVTILQLLIASVIHIYYLLNFRIRIIATDSLAQHLHSQRRKMGSESLHNYFVAKLRLEPKSSGFFS